MAITERELLQLIDKLLQGKASPEEEVMLEAWFRSFDDATAIVKTDIPVEKQELKMRLFAGIQDGLPESTKTVRRDVPVVRPGRSVFRYSIAAACVLLVGWASFLTIKRMSRSAKPVYKEWRALSRLERIVLEDSSIVWLHPGSRIQVAVNEGSPDRDVFLQGEAFFEVRHDPRRLFTVHHDSLEIQDIGTKFNVKAYSGDQQWKVTVWQGEVSAKSGVEKKRPDTLIAGQEWLFNNSTHSGRVVSTDHFTDTPWEPGRLYFSNEYLSDIAHQLEAKFGVSLQFSRDTIRNMQFSGTFSADEDIEHILFIIGKANGINYKHHDKAIILY